MPLSLSLALAADSLFQNQCTCNLDFKNKTHFLSFKHNIPAFDLLYIYICGKHVQVARARVGHAQVTDTRGRHGDMQGRRARVCASLSHSLCLGAWQLYNSDPRTRLRKAQGAELKLGDSCRNGTLRGLNIDPLKSQLLPSVLLHHFLTRVLSHPWLQQRRGNIYAPKLPEACLYPRNNGIKKKNQKKRTYLREDWRSEVSSLKNSLEQCVRKVKTVLRNTIVNVTAMNSSNSC